MNSDTARAPDDLHGLHENDTSSQPLPSTDRTSPTWAVAAGTPDRAARTSWRRHPLLMLSRRMRRRPPPPQQAPTVSRQELLVRLRELPSSVWSYGWEDDEVRHLGPMAQDFWHTFGLGTSDRRIDVGDAVGVCMATICALADRVDELERRLAAAQPTTRDRTDLR